MGFSKAPSRPLNYYGEDHGYRYIVLERLEYDLMKLAESPVPISKISKIGIEILEGFEELHSKYYCFVDVKPDNFMIKKDKVYFVDFGLIEKYIDISTGKHKTLQSSTPLVGTPTFSSLNRHAGFNHSRRDDIEAMGYMLLSLCSNGKLPWSAAKSDSQLYEMKKACEILKLCKEYGCDEIGEIIKKARSMEFDAVPNYEEFVDLLKKMSTVGMKRGIPSSRSNVSIGASTAGGGRKVAKIDSNKNVQTESVATKKISAAVTKQSASKRNVTMKKEDCVSTPKIRNRRALEQKDEEVKEIRVTRSRRSSGSENTSASVSTLYWKVLEGAHAGEEFELNFSSSVESIGRGEDNFICLKNDMYVSENHATLRLSSNNVSIEVKDNRTSTNKFKLNSVKFNDSKWHVMQIGDVIQFGLSKITLTSRS